MALVVLDASALLAFIRREAGAAQVLPHIGNAIVSAVTLQEVIEALTLEGLPRETIGAILAKLRLDVRAHDVEAAYTGGALVQAACEQGLELGDRACLGLGLSLGLPVITANPTWANLQIDGLRLEHLR